MHINPYGAAPVELMVDLGNRPPESVADLVSRCEGHGVLLERETQASDLDAVRELVSRWKEIIDEPSETRRADSVNALMADWASAPVLTNHAGDGWHLHYRADPASTAAMLGALCGVGTAMFLIHQGMDRIARCRADGCEVIFADQSRNLRQRYCSPACANRSAVRRHRARGLNR